MGVSGTIMAGSMALQGTNSILSSQQQARAMKAQGAFRKQQADANARMAMIQSDAALESGDRAAGVARRKGSAIEGAQKLAAAAQGIDINAGSALDLQLETQQMSEIDVNTIKNNAWREAWGYRAQADNLTGQGNMAASSANFNARSTVLTGGIQAGGYALQGLAAYSRGQTAQSKVDDGSQPDADRASSAGNNYNPQDATAASLKTSEYGKDWREVKKQYNPLYPGYGMTSSWWLTDEEF